MNRRHPYPCSRAGLRRLPAAALAVILTIPLLPGLALADVALGGGNSPAVAINPLDAMNLAIASPAQLRVSTDGGATFSAPVLATVPETHLLSAGIEAEPRLAFDSQGRLYWAHVGQRIGVDGYGGGYDLFFAQADPTTGAVLPGFPVYVNELAGHGVSAGETTAFTGFGLAADSHAGSPFQDRVYLTWTAFSGGSSRQWISHSTDGGATWAAGVALGGANASEKGTYRIAVAPNGDLLVSSHRQEPTGTTGRIRVDRSTDGGLTFSNTLALAAGEADVSPNFQDNTATSIPGYRVGTFPHNRGNVLADPLVPGRWYVIAMDDPDDNHSGGDAADIQITISTDSGATWSTPARVDDGAPGTLQLSPTATIDPASGRITVAWWDNRNGMTNGDGNFLLDVFATYSDDGGATFVSDFQLNSEVLDPEAGASCWGGCSGWYVGLWGSGPDDVFAVGTWPSGGPGPHTNASRWDGSTWTQIPTPTSTGLFAVWGSSSSDVYAAGRLGYIARWDGASWANVASPTGENINGLWGSASDDVFGVGDNGTIIHFDGSSWSTMTSPTSEFLVGIWGSSGSDVFAAGANGTIIHYDGVSWSGQTSGTGEFFQRLWGTGPASVFGVTNSGNVYRYDGTTWSFHSSPTTSQLMGIWGTSDSDIHVCGWGGLVGHWDGSSWTTEKISEIAYTTIWGSGAGEVRTAGLQYFMSLDPGSGWAEEDDPTGPRPAVTFHGGGGLEIAARDDRIHAVYVGNFLDAHGNPSGQQTFYTKWPAGTATPWLVADTAPRLALEAPRPNPFRGTTELSFRIPAGAGIHPASLDVYDAAGRRVRSVLAGARGPGRHTVLWDGSDQRGRPVAAGIYFARLRWEGEARTARIVRLR